MRCCLYSDLQYQRGTGPAVNAGDVALSPVLFDPSAKIEWSPVWSLRDKRFKYLPTSMLYFFYQGSVAFLADSNGCAAGNTREEAIVQGFLELVERDAYAICGTIASSVLASTFPILTIPSCGSSACAGERRTPPFGARHHQRSRHSELCRGDAMDAGWPGKYRVRLRLSLRCADRSIANAHRVEPIPLDRSDARQAP